MSSEREIRSYDYVNHPYKQVRDALATDLASILRQATRSAASRSEALAAGLSINLGGIEVGTEIAVTAGDLEETKGSTDLSRRARLPIQWEAAKRPQLFPLMSAVLTIYPLTAHETQLDFLGKYRPPIGALGKLIDSVAGHKIAEATVHRFVADIAEYLRKQLH